MLGSIAQLLPFLCYTTCLSPKILFSKQIFFYILSSDCLWGSIIPVFIMLECFSRRALIALHWSLSSHVTHNAFISSLASFCLFFPELIMYGPGPFQGVPLIKIDSCCYHSANFSGIKLSALVDLHHPLLTLVQLVVR